MSRQISTDALTAVEETAFITLHARDVDARADHPVLGDDRASAIAADVDYDYAKLASTAKSEMKERFNVAIRARLIDEWLTSFVSQHGDAVVLDLGCGLDTRAFRVDPPVGVDWYDVDLPGIAALRRQLVPHRTGVHSQATSVTAPDWLEQLPTHRPVAVVADGFFPFVSNDEFRSLLARMTSHFRSGELLMNGYSRLSSKLMTKVVPAMRRLGVDISEGFDDPRDLEQWNPDLSFTERRLLITSPYVDAMPTGYRLQCKAMASVPWLARYDMGVLRYTFARD